MRISDWSSDVCSSDLVQGEGRGDTRWAIVNVLAGECSATGTAIQHHPFAWLAIDQMQPMLLDVQHLLRLRRARGALPRQPLAIARHRRQQRSQQPGAYHGTLWPR